MELWNEIINTLRKNKMRTFLTGFSVAWGIFMLVILLGAGNGLKNGVTQNFEGEANNAIFLWPGTTSKTFDGLQKGRDIHFSDDDVTMINKQMPAVERVSATISIPGVTLSFGKEYGAYSIKGVNENYSSIENIRILPDMGRFINSMDIRENRKTMIISDKMREVLFKKENPVGKYVNAGKIAYLIVGVYTIKEAREANEAIIPFTTAQSVYNFKAKGFSNIVFTVTGLETEQANKEYETMLRNRMGRLHTFAPDDENALYIWNKLQHYLQTLGIFNAINLFVWIIGIGTLIAGIVGVSNIMLITVKERTKEFGIRKAIGASPVSILKMILLESVLITSIFGLTGMFAGVMLTEAANYIMVQNTPKDADMTIFANPTVDLRIVFSATLLLIFAGMLAGYFPARKAVRIKPIEALHYE